MATHHHYIKKMIFDESDISSVNNREIQPENPLINIKKLETFDNKVRIDLDKTPKRLKIATVDPRLSQPSQVSDELQEGDSDDVSNESWAQHSERAEKNVLCEMSGRPIIRSNVPTVASKFVSNSSTFRSCINPIQNPRPAQSPTQKFKLNKKSSYKASHYD